MIEKRIKALYDMNLKNDICSKSLVTGEVTTFCFINSLDMAAVLNTGRIELVGNDVPESKEIPVVEPQDHVENELLEQLELTGCLDKLQNCKIKPEEIESVDPLYNKETE